MTRVPRPGQAVSSGPFEDEAQARAVPAVRAVYAEPPGQGRWAPLNHRMICEALSAAGVDVGAYDHRIIMWLSGWEPQTVAVVAGMISRAHEAGARALAPAVLAGNAGLTPEQVRTVLDALDVAADWQRDRTAGCPDRDADPAGLCGTCESRLARADEYDALAALIGGAR